METLRPIVELICYYLTYRVMQSKMKKRFYKVITKNYCSLIGMTLLSGLLIYLVILHQNDRHAARERTLEPVGIWICDEEADRPMRRKDSPSKKPVDLPGSLRSGASRQVPSPWKSQ